MATARYDIVRDTGGWVIKHDNEISPAYDMPEAAFEAALAAASLSIRNRHDVVVSLTHGEAASSAGNPRQATSDPNIHG